MTIIEPRHRTPVARHLVLAWMAALSVAAGYSCELYVSELLALLPFRPLPMGEG